MRLRPHRAETAMKLPHGDSVTIETSCKERTQSAPCTTMPCSLPAHVFDLRMRQSEFLLPRFHIKCNDGLVFRDEE